MRKLSQREMVLIWIAVILLLLSGGYYLVKLPSDRARLAAETQLRILRLQMEEEGTGITDESSLKAEVEEKRKLAVKKRENCLPYRTNSMLIPEITGPMKSFAIEPEEVEVQTVYAVTDEGEAQEPYTIYQAVVRVKASGTTEDFYRFLDWTNERDWIIVTSYSQNGRIEETASASDSSREYDGGRKDLDLMLSCLMVKSYEEGGAKE